MEPKNQSRTTETDEDDYWAKEFDIPADQLKKHDASIYDLIADAHIKTQNSSN
jgi:hypothetical protein